MSCLSQSFHSWQSTGIGSVSVKKAVDETEEKRETARFINYLLCLDELEAVCINPVNGFNPDLKKC